MITSSSASGIVMTAYLAFVALQAVKAFSTSSLRQLSSPFYKRILRLSSDCTAFGGVIQGRSLCDLLVLSTSTRAPPYIFESRSSLSGKTHFGRCGVLCV